MSAAGLLAHFANGLASASSLFLVAAGLSLIFGVSRVVNFAHGSLYMLGLYLAYSLVDALGGLGAAGFWAGVLLAAGAVAAIGTVVEVLVLRRIYGAPELFALLATFALTLIARDGALWIWGPEDLLGPRAPGLEGAVGIAGARLPEYDLLLIVVGPLVLLGLWLLLTRTRWGTLVRAATADREMAGALGVDPRRLFTSVFALGAFLAGLGGALQLPREPAQLALDIGAVTDAFVVVVVGGLGSVPGAFLAALLIGEVKALCIAIGQVELLGSTFSVSKLTLVAEFLVMAVVLVLRPWGLLGRPQASHAATSLRAPPPPVELGRRGGLLALALLAALALAPAAASPYTLVLLTDILVFALLAASLHLLLGPAGLVSFGHAAYFGLGAYGSALLLVRGGWPMEAALAVGPLAAAGAALAFGGFCVRLSGVYLAMLTLAFAQIVWSIVFQWDAFTGGSNGVVGVWPAPWLAAREAYYLLALVLCAAGLAGLRRLAFSPLGWALRAARDSPLKAEAIGVDTRRVQWAAFTAAGALAGVSGALHAFSKGSISPEVLGIGRSVDALVMVLLGGVNAMTGPAAGAAALTWLQDVVARNTDYWRALLGACILGLVLAFPEGIMGRLERAVARVVR